MFWWTLLLASIGWTVGQDCQVGGIYNSVSAKCVHFMGVQLKWLDAERVCENLAPGGRLVSIASSYEQGFVFSRAQQQILGVDFWTSGSDINHDGVWTWIDQTPISYQNWAPQSPVNTDGMQCIYLESGFGQWKVTTCLEEKKAVACQTKPLNPPDLTNWTYVDETNAYYKPLNKSKSWNDFENACQAEGGHLASIHRDRENSIVIQVGSNIQGCQQWAIGLRSNDFVKPFNWTWTDGTPVDYLNWHGSNPSGDNPCGFLRSYDEGWMNQKCTTPLLNMCAVCEKPGPSQ